MTQPQTPGEALTPDELLTTTRTVRKRLDLSRPVPIELVRQCLEIALEGPSGSSCVEVTRAGDVVLVRDSKNSSGPVLEYTPQEWRAFLRGVKAGEFDDYGTSASGDAR